MKGEGNPTRKEFYDRPQDARSSGALHPSREEKWRKAGENPTRPPLKGGEMEKGGRKPHPASPQGRRNGERRKKTPPGLPSREEKRRKAEENPTRPPLKGGEKEKGGRRKAGNK